MCHSYREKKPSVYDNREGKRFLKVGWKKMSLTLFKMQGTNFYVIFNINFCLNLNLIMLQHSV